MVGVGGDGQPLGDLMALGMVAAMAAIIVIARARPEMPALAAGIVSAIWAPLACLPFASLAGITPGTIGLMAGFASVLLTGRIGSTRPNIAMGWELDAITMVILGGVSINGGSGSLLGVVLAIVVLGMFTFGLQMMNVPGIVMSMILGGLLIVSMIVPILIRARKPRAVKAA